jgi:anionic cell wall polymer biosynthesis LytR-Cps2A-Psr (LCP) family protein
MEALADTLELTLGIPIPFWVLVDMQGFVDLVDAIGGVDVNALEPMHVTFSPERVGAEEIRIDIEPGRHHLDGRTALAYVRNRSDSNDLVRTRRQRCMLREVASSLDPLTLLANFGEITDAIEHNATTNIPLRLLPSLVEVAGGLDRGAITTMAFQSGYYGPDRNYRGLHIVDVERVRQKVRSVLNELSVEEPVAGDDECS